MIYEHPWYTQQRLLESTTTCELESTQSPQQETTGQRLTKVCSKCNLEKPIDDFRNEKSRNWRIASKDQIREYRREECKDCERRLAKQLREAKKTAPPKPDKCDCCVTTTDALVVDHDHVSGKFRGWLCKSCNIGIGKLGDNIEGLQQALNYLSTNV